MIKVYIFSTGRNKLHNGISISGWKKKLYQGKCDNCGEDYGLTSLELEHSIPVRIGGSLVNQDNLKLFCSRCHRKKTRKDVIVINILKRLNLLVGCTSYIEPSELQKIYLYIYKLLEEGEKNYRIWYDGKNGIDYEEIMWRENRGDTDGNTTTTSS